MRALALVLLPAAAAHEPAPQQTEAAYDAAGGLRETVFLRKTQADTSASAVDYDRLSAEVFGAMNKLRQTPEYFIPKVERDLANFVGETKQIQIEPNFYWNTWEGKPAWTEALAKLKELRDSTAPKPVAHSWSNPLAYACVDHCNDQGPTEATGHTGSSGSTMGQRILKFGTWWETIGENIQYGVKTGDEVVLQLFIDDGVPGRGHRVNLLKPEFKLAGVACGPHKKWRHMCTIDYAGRMGGNGVFPAAGPASNGNLISLTGAPPAQPVATAAALVVVQTSTTAAPPVAGAAAEEEGECSGTFSFLKFWACWF